MFTYRVVLERQTFNFRGLCYEPFQERGQKVCCKLQGITLLSLPGEVYARLRGFKRSNAFCPGCRTLDLLYPSHKSASVSPHVLCGSCPSRHPVGGALRL